MKSVKLEAEGFFLSLDTASEIDFHEQVPYFKGSVVLASAIAFPRSRFHVDACFPVSDLERLCEWVEKHISSLAQTGIRPFGGSPPFSVWVPLDTSMQVQLLNGEVEREDRRLVGSFAMTVLLNLGANPASGSSVYGGLQGEVEVREALSFCKAIRELVARNARSGAGL